MGGPLEKSTLSFSEKPFTFIWVNKTVSGCFVSPTVDADAQVLERCTIGIERASVRPKHTDVLRCKIQDLSELCFLLADFLLGVLAFGNVLARDQDNRITCPQDSSCCFAHP